MSVDLLKVNPSCSLLQLLVPPIDVIQHDHNYACSRGPQSSTSPTISKNILDTDDQQNTVVLIPSILPSPRSEKINLIVTSEERNIIEKETRCQSQSSKWFSVRTRRITGSKCGRILSQHRQSEALLVSVLYPKRLNPDYLPKPHFYQK